MKTLPQNLEEIDGTDHSIICDNGCTLTGPLFDKLSGREGKPILIKDLKIRLNVEGSQANGLLAESKYLEAKSKYQEVFSIDEGNAIATAKIIEIDP